MRGFFFFLRERERMGGEVVGNTHKIYIFGIYVFLTNDKKKSVSYKIASSSKSLRF